MTEHIQTDVKALEELFKRSHENPTDDELQQQAIQEAVNYVYTADTGHLFCDRSLNAAATHALVLFSFEGDTAALQWIQDKLATSLDGCVQCISLFQRSRIRLKEVFMRERGVPSKSVQAFSDVILNWESSRLVTKMNGALASYESTTQLNSKAPVPGDLVMCFIECLAGPNMLRLNTQLRALFDKCIRILLKRDHDIVTKCNALSPGFLFLAYEGDELEKNWAFRMLDKLYDPAKLLTAAQIHNDVVEEFEYQLKDSQKGKVVDERLRESFYRAIYPLFRLADSDAILNWLAHFAKPRAIDLENDDVETPKLEIFLVLRGDILSYPDGSFPYVIRFLQLLLERVGSKFWGEIESFTFQNILNAIIKNGSLVKHLCMVKDTKPIIGELNPTARISDLFDWITSFLSSLKEAQKIKTVETLSLHFIEMLEHESAIPLDIKSVLFIRSCEMLSDVLRIDSQLYTGALNTDLLARSDARAFVDTKLVRFCDYATHTAIFFPEEMALRNGAVGKVAIQVITSSLRFDILTFAQNSYEINRGQRPPTLRFSPNLIQAISKQNFNRHLEFCFQVLCVLDNVSTILPVGSPSHIADVKIFLTHLSEFLTRLIDVDSKHIKKMLYHSKSLRGYWACVFSPTESVYQSALYVIYEAFDANGRLEAVQALLSNNIEAGISAINDNLTNLIFIEFYEPCPRAVKVLSDVIQALNSPVDGLFSESEKFNSSTRDSLVTFWNRCWKFLDLIYTKTLKWAEKYSDLVEFTRDTLDLSHAVLGCFRTIKDVFQDDDSTTVFNEITNTFEHMLVWLRLSDPGLLASCVQLIASTVDLATELEYKLSPKVVNLLGRYGSKSKGFNNKLTESQSEEILDRARIFDSDLVDKIVSEAEAHRRAKLGIPEPKSSSSSRSSTPGVSLTSSKLSSLAAPRMKGQMKVDNFASLARGPPVAPGKKALPLSSMEIARQKIKAKKAADALQERQRQKSQDLDDNDDDDDDQVDDTHELFNLPKPKVSRPRPTNERSHVTLLDDNKPKRRAFDDKKREEEFSRLRLNVDMKPLYRTILRWSFARDDEYPDSELSNLQPVTDKFANFEEYQNIYEPLLLVECWQALCSARSREDFKPLNINIGAKSSVNDFFEVFSSLTKAQVSEHGISDSDLVVLALAEEHKERPSIKDIKKSKVTCLAKVHEIKFLKGDRVDLTLRVTRSASLNQWLNPHVPIMMMRIMQMTTVEREYSSLMGLKYYNLADQILKAQPRPSAQISSSAVEDIRKKYDVNESQANAIGVSVATEGFSLIQGPPGTGKTKTILGIIGHMLSTFRAPNAIAVPGQPTPSSITSTRKVLVCAPSNAAVDELVQRLKAGVRNSKGDLYTPKLVRLGRSDAVNATVKDVTLEELVDRQLGKTDPIANNTGALLKELGEFRKQLDECKKLIADEKTPAGDDVYNKKRMLTSQINNVKKKLDEERERQNSAYRSREITRRNCQAKILGEAEIICSTLSGSAHDMVANLGIKFDSVIIDEACQCTELSVVIPLRYGCKRCVMVGDPNQLPPTVLSNAAANSKYDQSLFVRMANNTKPLLLNVQYRMNSAISRFPSQKFYDGELKDGPQNDALTIRPWHENKLFPPYMFYDIVQGQQTQNKKTFSYTNRTEVDIAMELVYTLLQDYKRLDFKNKVGIITPYKEQNQLLKSSFIREFGKGILSEISFNTIDGFQGQEKEIIIMSCVRADPTGHGVGFLRDFRRMNVALTRPKCSLWILGHHDSLVKNTLWRDLITDAKERGCISEARRGFTSGKVTQPPLPKRDTDNSTPVTGRKNSVSKETGQDPVPSKSGTLPAPKSKSGTLPPPKPKPASSMIPSSQDAYSVKEPPKNTPHKANNASESSSNTPYVSAITTPTDSQKESTDLPPLPTGPMYPHNRQYNGPNLPSQPASSRSGSLPPLPTESLPTGPASSRSGTLPPPPSSFSTPGRPLDSRVPNSSGQLPPRPTNSGVIGPPDPRKRPPKGPASLFIQKQKRHKRR